MLGPMRRLSLAALWTANLLLACSGAGSDGPADTALDAPRMDAGDAGSSGADAGAGDAPEDATGYDVATDATKYDAHATDAASDATGTDAAAGALAPVTLTALPATADDLVAPMRGVHYWLGTERPLAMDVPVAGTWTSPLDHYARFHWRQLETDAGTYDFTRLDKELAAAIDAGRKLAFGVQTLCPASNCGGLPVVGGASLSYPTPLHAKMQAEAVPDWAALATAEGAFWVPNWNSPSFLSAWARLLAAVGAHLDAGSYKGVAYKNAIAWIDVRGLGLWGEWHNYAWGSVPNPAGTAATAASLIQLIDAHKTAFPDAQLVGFIGMFAAKEINPKNPSFVVPAEVSCYAAQTKNLRGELGWRRDNWGTNATWLADFLEANPIVCPGGAPLKQLIMDKWKVAPITGEPNGSATTAAAGGSCAFYDLEREVRFYHASTIGNGNWGGAQTQACAQTFVRAASKASGYRLAPEGGSYTPVVPASRALSVQLAWRNQGVAPTYEPWAVTFELRDAAGATVWSGASKMTLQRFLPEATARVVDDTFVLPATLKSDSYRLVLIARDPTGYRKPLPLALGGRTADGGYPVGTVRTP